MKTKLSVIAGASVASRMTLAVVAQETTRGKASATLKATGLADVDNQLGIK